MAPMGNENRDIASSFLQRPKDTGLRPDINASGCYVGSLVPPLCWLKSYVKEIILLVAISLRNDTTLYIWELVEDRLVIYYKSRVPPSSSGLLE